jgi:hypothetical protein
MAMGFTEDPEGVATRQRMTPADYSMIGSMTPGREYLLP